MQRGATWRLGAFAIPLVVVAGRVAGAVELQGVDPNRVTEIGEVLDGATAGRRSADEITLFKSTGHAVEDIATAALVHQRAVAAEIGTTVNL